MESKPDFLVKKSLSKREKTELMFIWGLFVVVFLGFYLYLTIGNFPITGMAVTAVTGKAFSSSLLMWIVLLAGIVLSAVLVSWKMKPAK